MCFSQFRPQSFWVIARNLNEGSSEQGNIEFLEATLTGHFDHGKVGSKSVIIIHHF